MTSVDIAPTPLTTLVTTRLIELEAIVAAGLDTFVAVGMALAEIQTSRLYRATHDTFEAYVRQQFHLSRSRAYEIIGSATTFEALSAMADIPVPQNERQARALAGLEPSEAAEVMVLADKATDGNFTSAEIGKARAALAPTQPRLPSAAAAPPAHADDDEECEPSSDDGSSEIDSAIMDLQRKVRRLATMDRLGAAEAGELSLVAAAALAEMVETLRSRRESVDPIHTLAIELAEVYTGRSVEAIESDIEAAFMASRKYHLDIRRIRRLVTAKYDKGAGRSAVVGPTHVVIEVGANTAVVTSGWPVVRGILVRLGVRGMKDHKRGLMCFPARHADDVQAHAEFRRQRVELVRHADR